MPREDVRNDLAEADVVVAKVDAPNEELFQQINRPAVNYSLDEILSSIKLFREKFKGRLALQMMFIEANKNYARELAKIAKELLPDEVHIDTPLRPCALKPLTPEEIAGIRDEFGGIKGVVTVYEASRPEVIPLNLEETLRRRRKL
jgi:wyosine [tRNA(Phe)-imidazoG37] synthetase (radical SAM superfamily)